MIYIFMGEGNIPVARQTTKGTKVSEDTVRNLAQSDRLASALQNWVLGCHRFLFCAIQKQSNHQTEISLYLFFFASLHL